MKTSVYTSLAALLLISVSCEQDLVEHTASPCPSDDPLIVCPEAPVADCPADASAGDADFSKFVAIGTSYTAGFQAGALFTEGQQRSVGTMLADRFACVGGGDFHQADIRSEHGFNLFINPNPAGTAVLGRFRLQGTPPQPAPVSSGAVGTSDALPNPMANAAFQYTGSTGAVAPEDLNDFSVPAILLGQSLIYETGDWTLADIDPAPGAQPHPYFSPFFARFASDPGNTSLIEDAAASVANNGSFVLFWLGMDDALLHAAYGGDDTRVPLTSLAAFEGQYSFAVGSIFLANPEVKGVLANFPDPFVMPHFTAVPYNPVPLDAATAAMASGAFAGYNQILDALKGAPFNYPAEEVDARKISFVEGNNPFVIIDETLENYTDEFDMLQAGGHISPEQRAALAPYVQVRQTTASDVIPLSTATVLGTLADPENPLSIRGVAVPLGDQYALIPSEVSTIRTRLGEFNAHVKSVAEDATYGGRLAFADVHAAQMAMITQMGTVQGAVLLTPNINPPTGIYSEDGLHPNARGYAFYANVIIDAINEQFGANVPHAQAGSYPATGLPINP